jgi:hypothetical protein
MLFFFFIEGHLPLVERLLQAGADPFKEDRHQKNPYHFAKRSFDTYTPPAWLSIQHVLIESQNKHIVVLDSGKGMKTQFSYFCFRFQLQIKYLI